MHNGTVDSLREFPLGKGISLGSDELVQESDSFTAIITINRDTTETWTLLMGATRGGNTEGHYEAYLTNGERKILLSNASSNEHGDSYAPWTAFGYEFVENGQSLGALQYRGGLFGITYLVWIHRSLDAKMKLILASAMTAVLQIRAL